MMCFGGGGGRSSQQQQPAGLAPSVPISVDPVVQQARNAAIQRTKAAAGSNSTIMTRAQVTASQRRSLLGGEAGGISGAAMGAPAANKTLLGQ